MVLYWRIGCVLEYSKAKEDHDALKVTRRINHCQPKCKQGLVCENLDTEHECTASLLSRDHIYQRKRSSHQSDASQRYLHCARRSSGTHEIGDSIVVDSIKKWKLTDLTKRSGSKKGGISAPNLGSGDEKPGRLMHHILLSPNKAVLISRCMCPVFGVDGVMCQRQTMVYCGGEKERDKMFLTALCREALVCGTQYADATTELIGLHGRIYLFSHLLAHLITSS